MVDGLNHSNSQTGEIFKPLAEPEIVKELPRQIAGDTLSMLLDAVNSSAAGLIITDMDGTIRFANPAFCRMFDYALSETTGKNAAELFFARKIRKFSDVIAMLDLSSNDTEEFVVETKDGRRFAVEVAASNVTSASGEIVGRMASFINISRRKEIEADKERLIKQLQDALDNIKVLKGIIPICASCKKIRDDKGYWKQIESYLKEHSDADFSHGICPECAKKLYPQFFK